MNTFEPIFSETVILKDQHRAFSILLHTITIRRDTIAGYSDKFDSLMTFPSEDQDYKALQDKLDQLPSSLQNCNACHRAKWN